jgi:hypothetical protein
MAETDADLVDRMAKRHTVSPAAVQVVMAALRSGGGRMAQFSHPDFGGMSQWSPGMSMVGDMFNTQLKAKLDALCSEIAAHLDLSGAAAGTRSAADEVSYRSMSGSADWWPAGLGRPGAVGGQNDLRYAVFPGARRLVINDRGAPSRSTTQVIIGFSVSPRPKAATERSRSREESCRLIAQGRRQEPLFHNFCQLRASAGRISFCGAWRVVRRRLKDINLTRARQVKSTTTS